MCVVPALLRGPAKKADQALCTRPAVSKLRVRPALASFLDQKKGLPKALATKTVVVVEQWLL